MKEPKQFGVRPILMQRADGGLRIIYPNGKVGWVIFDERIETELALEASYACTNRRTQKAAYLACVKHDMLAQKLKTIEFNEPHSMSAFLGYL